MRFEVATTNEEGETLNGRLQSFLSSLLTSIGGVFGHSQEESEMASRPAAPIEDKQKNAPAEGRNRRALRDIGNLGKHVEGKPQTNNATRPVTRSFCAELLANAQAHAEKNRKPLAEVVNGGAALRVAAGKGKPAMMLGAQNKTASPEKGAESKERITVTGQKSSERSSKKKAKAAAFSSILTARSKAACEVANKPKDPVVNIDAEDANDELAVVEYVDDIYKFYKHTEDENQIVDYMGKQKDMNGKMRSILVDWLIEVHNKFELMPETLYLTINVVDRYLSMNFVSRKELQLVGIGSMLIACKYEEIWAPEVDDFVCISDKTYTKEQILVMEKSILGKLEWHLTVPTPYVFLVRYIKASVSPDKEMENMVFFLAELGLMHYSTVVLYRPSVIAASAVYAARLTLDKNPSWSETLKHHTGYSEDQLMDCAKLLVSFHLGAAEGKLKAAYRKFSNPDRGTVALLPPAKTLLAAAE
ncbi:G2/mitotic-specific cyclin S13-7-like [Malania oleifera]|uniref:G2/mitotic-specific cyclin S13-7-like n=1 Tax=Malania oleifera TaxID=397392 RepID=UPI0025ADA8D2|nr:G2/mitotic-specific cyclin S13-7-like [Malania oleifera]